MPASRFFKCRQILPGGVGYVLYLLLLLVGILMLMAGCTGPSEQRVQTPSASVTSPSGPLTQLRPEGVLPSSCPVTPVYQGGQKRSISGAADIPWFQAQPTSSDILGYLFFAQGKTTKSGTYRFLHAGGSYPDGSTTKILWIVEYPQSSSSLQIDGMSLSNSEKTFHQTIAGEGEIPSIVVVPSAGCWRLQLSSGDAHGSIILWVVGG